jgi:hypothetical protein
MFTALKKALTLDPGETGESGQLETTPGSLLLAA